MDADKDIVEVLIASKLSSYAIAKATGITEATIGNYRRRKTRPTLANARILTRFFNEASSNPIENNASVLPDANFMLVPMVSKYAYAGYLAGYGDEEYVDTLPKMPFYIPEDQTARGEYIAIEVKGDSMDDGSPESILDGDILLCRRISRGLWCNSKLHIKRWNFLIQTDEGILVKRIINHDIEEGTITIHSLNDMYPDRMLDLREVKQIFNVVQLTRKPIL